MTFSLHPQLNADTRFVAACALSDVLLMNDARFPWLVLVPRVPDVCELIDLSQAQRLRTMEEVDHASRVLLRRFAPDKLNVAALGNMVPQLHVHIIARFKTDAAWPKPVWGVGTAQPYEDAASDALVGELAKRLGDTVA